MPTIRKLDSEEISAHKKAKLNQHQQAISRYDALLIGIAPGEWVEVVLEAGDSQLKARNRLVSSAKRRGLYLSFRCRSGNSVHFEVKVAQRPEVEEWVE